MSYSNLNLKMKVQHALLKQRLKYLLGHSKVILQLVCKNNTLFAKIKPASQNQTHGSMKHCQGYVILNQSNASINESSN